VGVGFLYLGLLSGIQNIDLVRANLLKVFFILAYTLFALILFAWKAKVDWLAGFALAPLVLNLTPASQAMEVVSSYADWPEARSEAGRAANFRPRTSGRDRPRAPDVEVGVDLAVGGLRVGREGQGAGGGEQQERGFHFPDHRHK